ncbi:MAG: hypothetical protein S4CHLAM20_04310 [Chlamydiia bacterium]|nr:hypothetical protein [Chlamydiia bacterium]
MKKLIINGLITMVIGSIGTVMVAWFLDYGKLKEVDRARIEKEIAIDYESKIIEIMADAKKENEVLRNELNTSLKITREIILHDNNLTLEAIKIITSDSLSVTQGELDSIYSQMLTE